MVIDIASLDLKERPVLALENLDETPIAILGNAFNLEAHIAYNDTSSITFDLPAYVNGVKTPGYDDVVGTRLIRLAGWGVFILVNPETTGNGIREIKSCKAYSREYEFTYKKMSLEENTYNLWNPVTPASSILGIVLSYLPYWSVGTVDSDLIGKYRTFSENNVNIYNFLKSTVQTKYGCIVDFDTVNRRINLRSTANHASRRPVFLSLSNLAKEIEREEDTENIFTCLDVNGADGVTIRGVNPTGTNKIYNLDYYMNTSHFSQAFINKWNAWKAAFEAAQDEYYLLTIERTLKTSEIIFAQSEVDDTGNAELKALEAQQSVYIELLARSDPGGSSYESYEAELHRINQAIEDKQSELATKRTSITALEAEKAVLTAELEAINQSLAFDAFFTSDELMLLKQYFKEDSISDSSFVYAEAKNYDGEDETAALTSSSTFMVSGSVHDTTTTGSGQKIIKCSGGSVTIGTLSASLIKATAEYNPTTHHTVFTAYLSSGSFGTRSFPDGCLTAVTDGGTFSESISLSFAGGTGRMYFTRNTTEYEKYAVEWDLYEYGRQCLEKLAYPSYSFSLETANFLSIDAFQAFKNALTLGDKVYIDMDNAGVLEPIFIGFELEFENASSLKLEFGDKYCLKDAAFELADLLNQSVSMGKTVDVSRFGYNAFIDSGASTAVKDYMDAALDVSKQAILSSGEMAITWDESGIRLRKWNQAHNGYEDEQIAIINNNIVFTDDAWESAKMAIGHFVDANEGDSWGVVAPSVVGTLLAGENLVIESKKQDGGIAVFKVDADGAVLHNSKFDIVRSNTVGSGQTQTYTQILLDPNLGFGLGKYPVSTVSGNSSSWNTNNAKFWVDMNGNVHFKGTLEGANGTFSGSLSAATGTFAGSLQAATGTFSGNLSAAGGTFSGTVQASRYLDSNGNDMFSNDKFGADWLNLKGLTIKNNSNVTTFEVDSNGNVTVSGNITMGSGSSINWNTVSQSNGTATLNSDFSNPSKTAGAVKSTADNAASTASSAQTTANTANTNALSAKTIAAQIAEGTYTGTTIDGTTYTGTFINGTSIFSPTIYANEFVAKPPTTSSGYDNTGGFLLQGYYGGSLRNVFRIHFNGNGNQPMTYLESWGDLQLPSYVIISDQTQGVTGGYIQGGRNTSLNTYATLQGYFKVSGALNTGGGGNESAFLVVNNGVATPENYFSGRTVPAGTVYFKWD